jgi:GNAT superfamily N-acetyltransferase
MAWQPRIARESDIPRLEELIPLSVRALQSNYYSVAQMEAALGPVFGVDRQLIKDETFFVVEAEEQIAGCGGWSKRQSLFGGDGARSVEDPELNPATEPARIRAFFVRPASARQGIGRSILQACEDAIVRAGFQRIELVATLAGEPLYAAHHYATLERYTIQLRDSLVLPVVRMGKRIGR